jgi:hypothetical protein
VLYDDTVMPWKSAQAMVVAAGWYPDRTYGVVNETSGELLDGIGLMGIDGCQILSEVIFDIEGRHDGHKVYGEVAEIEESKDRVRRCSWNGGRIL